MLLFQLAPETVKNVKISNILSWISYSFQKPCVLYLPIVATIKNNGDEERGKKKGKSNNILAFIGICCKHTPK